MVIALNCRPCSLSLTHQPSALSHSPAGTEGSDPTTVVSSRCPRAFTRSTQKPLSSLWKVTRSTSPEISSVAGLRSGIAAFMCRDSFSHELLWLASPVRKPICGHSAALMGFGSAGTYQRCWEALWPSRNRVRGGMATVDCDPIGALCDLAVG